MRATEAHRHTETLRRADNCKQHTDTNRHTQTHTDTNRHTQTHTDTNRHTQTPTVKPFTRCGTAPPELQQQDSAKSAPTHGRTDRQRQKDRQRKESERQARTNVGTELGG